jgi:hypothetical protein
MPNHWTYIAELNKLKSCSLGDYILAEILFHNDYSIVFVKSGSAEILLIIQVNPC